MSSETPKKPVRRGRKPKQSGPSDFCRVCKVNFRLNVGILNKSSFLSSENLFCCSKRAGTENVELAKILTDILELPLCEDSNLSSRVCAKCAVKIRNASCHVNFIRVNLNIPQDSFCYSEEIADENIDPVGDSIRFKRLAKSPASRIEKRRKSDGATLLRENSNAEQDERNESRRAKRPLVFHESSVVREAEVAEPSLAIDVDTSLYEKPQELEVEVDLRFPSGPRKRHISDDTSKNVIKNVVQGNWKAVVNIILKTTDHECADHVKEALKSSISKEFREYCRSDTSVLKYSEPSELAVFSNKLVHKEAEIMCPLWTSALEGAMGSYKPESLKAKRAVNVSALCTATAAKFRNNRMSALAHRVSVILLHSGAKIQDFLFRFLRNETVLFLIRCELFTQWGYCPIRITLVACNVNMF